MAGRIFVLTALAMLAFAGNSLLCRVALRVTAIDAASFTTIRLASGALVLWLLVRWTRRDRKASDGSWLAALALFAYAAGFSFAYVALPASTGALLLFAAVQVTMVGYGLWTGERLDGTQRFGFLLAIAGLVALLLPGLTAPPLTGTLLMVLAGVAWGVYSLLGRGGSDPLQTSAGSFVRTVPMTLALSVVLRDHLTVDVAGVALAITSGALTSAFGYVAWFAALPALTATTAATVQLSVPVIAAAGGIVLLGESVTLRLVLASVAILSGIALVSRAQGLAAR